MSKNKGGGGLRTISFKVFRGENIVKKEKIVEGGGREREQEEGGRWQILENFLKKRPFASLVDAY